MSGGADWLRLYRSADIAPPAPPQPMEHRETRHHDRHPGHRRWRPDRRRAPARARGARPGGAVTARAAPRPTGPRDRGGARLHPVLAAPDGVVHRRAVQPRGGRGDLRLPRPRPVRRALHPRRQGGQRPRRGRQVRPRARLRQGRHGRVLDGRQRGAPAGGAAPRRRRGGLGQRPRPLVLPRHRADAPGPLRGRKAPRPGVHQARAEDQDLARGLAGARPDAARRGGGDDLAHAAADRARRPGRLLPARARPAALRRRPRAQGVVAARPASATPSAPPTTP